jgi:hypothetical protein
MVVYVELVIFSLCLVFHYFYSSLWEDGRMDVNVLIVTDTVRLLLSPQDFRIWRENNRVFFASMDAYILAYTAAFSKIEEHCIIAFILSLSCIR